MAREPQIPLSVFRELVERQERHYDRIADMLKDHLEHVAALYEKALNPPLLTPPNMVTGPLYVTPDQEEIEWQLQHDLVTDVNQELRDRGLPEVQILK